MLVQGIAAHPRSSRAIRRSVALLGGVLACALAPAAAKAADPPANIPLGSVPAACSQESSTECQQWLLSKLNAARATLGLPAYQLPANFLGLSADKQIFILTDLDRSAYGYTPISGLNAALDEAAAAGVRNGTDPLPPATEAPWRGFGSDWASTGPLLAYFLWMYDDGYPGPNLDCASPGASGCWGHRHVILGEGLALPQPEVLGVATSTGGRSGTALIVSSHTGASTYYTWAQAQSEGAGSGTGGGKNNRTSAPAPGWGRRTGTAAATPSTSSATTASAATTIRHHPPPPPSSTCSRIAGSATMSTSALRGSVIDQLATPLSSKQSLQASITDPRVGVVRLTALTSASCTVTSSGREFHGVGSARLNGVGGYTASFTFFVGPSRSTLTPAADERIDAAASHLGDPAAGAWRGDLLGGASRAPGRRDSRLLVPLFGSKFRPGGAIQCSLPIRPGGCSYARD